MISLAGIALRLLGNLRRHGEIRRHGGYIEHMHANNAAPSVDA